MLVHRPGLHGYRVDARSPVLDLVFACFHEAGRRDELGVVRVDAMKLDRDAHRVPVREPNEPGRAPRGPEAPADGLVPAARLVFVRAREFEDPRHPRDGDDEKALLRGTKDRGSLVLGGSSRKAGKGSRSERDLRVLSSVLRGSWTVQIRLRALGEALRARRTLDERDELIVARRDDRHDVRWNRFGTTETRDHEGSR